MYTVMRQINLEILKIYLQVSRFIHGTSITKRLCYGKGAILKSGMLDIEKYKIRRVRNRG